MPAREAGRVKRNGDSPARSFRSLILGGRTNRPLSCLQPSMKFLIGTIPAAPVTLTAIARDLSRNPY